MSDQERGDLVSSEKDWTYIFIMALQGDSFPFILTSTNFLIDQYVYKALLVYFWLYPTLFKM